MKQRLGQRVRIYPSLLLAFFALTIMALPALAAPYAAMVIDARTGEVLHARNADARLHPASLTKMMTLYIAFEAIERGEISLDTMVKISRNAASEPPSKLGLRTGQKIKLRYLIRAAAVKSANDAATAIGEAISGSEAAFVRRMNRTAKALGMTRTTFKNANGLTRSGHLSTARDMTNLGRSLFYDYPQYYNLFSRKTTDAGVRKVNNTNRKLLASYKGADGIKTGFTNAAGFNLVASAERGDKRIIATVFGGRSSVSRNAQVAELLDLGFKRAPTRVAVRRPARPKYDAPPNSDRPIRLAGKTIRVVGAVRKSLRPAPRPTTAPVSAPTEAIMLALKDGIDSAVAEAQAEAPLKIAKVEIPVQKGLPNGVSPKLRPEKIVLASITPEILPVEESPEIVTRISTSGGRLWGVNIGQYGSRYSAERALLKMALKELATLDGSLRKVVQSNKGFGANFEGMTQEAAELACRRLQARRSDCTVLGPT